MDTIYFITILLLIYLINPLKDEEKLLTTPFLTTYYVIITSYLLSILNIPMYKWLYILFLIPFLIYTIFKHDGGIVNNLKKVNINVKKHHIILFFIILVSFLYIYFSFPPHPGNTTDVQQHSYKINIMLNELTIFHEKNPYINSKNRYYSDGLKYYPSGFHSLSYLLSDNSKDILPSFYLLIYFIILLFILGYYLLGNAIKKGLGIFSALFITILPVYFTIIKVLYPNTLGYALLIGALFFIVRYYQTLKKIYLYLFGLSVVSIIYTHTFPFIILTYYLISLIFVSVIYLIIKKIRKEDIKPILDTWIAFISSSLFAVLLLSTKMYNEILSYGKSKSNPQEIKIVVEGVKTTTKNKIVGLIQYINYFISENSIFIHNLMASMGIVYIYFTKSGKLDNEYTFVISLGLIFLFIVGVYRLIKGNIIEKSFFGLLILLILNMLNIEFFHIYIPFFSNQYDSLRMGCHIQIIMPIIYGMGLYYINNLINNIKNPKKHKILKAIFAIAILFYFSFSTVTNYTIQKEYIENTHYFVIDDNDLKLYDWINKNNITNQTFLNFGEDAGQYLPLYTKNSPFYTYYIFQSNNTTFGNLTFKELCQLVDNKNYEEFVNACKEENISYIFISDYIGQYDGGFFNNTKYFEILYQSGNAKIVKVK